MEEGEEEEAAVEEEDEVEEEEEEVDDGEESIPCWIRAASATAVSAASATAVSCGVSSGRQKTPRLLLLRQRRLPLDPTVPPRDANARLREVARARGPQGRQMASNLLQVEHASGILVPHTWTHAPNGLDKGCHSNGAPE